MILFAWLQASAKRVVEEKISMVRRMACWAPVVILEQRQWVEPSNTRGVYGTCDEIFKKTEWRVGETGT